MKEAKFSILIIEDNPADVEILLSHLAETKFSKSIIKCCDTLKEGMEMLSIESTDSVDVLIMDLSLPDCTGFTGLKKVINNHPNIPVIVLTGQIEEQYALEALHNGAQDYLVKQELSPQLLQRTIQYSIERYITTRTIQKSERKYELLINTMNEALLQVDEKENIVFVNDRFCQLIGYEKHELLGKYAVDILNFNEDKKYIQDKLEQRKQGASDKYELRLKTRSGDFVWVLVSGSPVFDEQNNFIGTIGIISDISHQKTLINTLKEREDRLRIIYDNSKVGITRIDFFSGTFLQVNKHFYKLLGYSKGELLNKSVFDIIHDDYVVQAEQMYNSFKDSSSPTTEGELKLNTKKGKVVEVQVSFSLIAPGKNPEYFVSVFKDITLQKQIERKLSENSKALVNFNRGLQETLAKQQEIEKELRQKNEELDTFVYKASHDLKGPLASIKGLSQIALNELKEPASIQYIEKIASSSDKLNHILNELINVSRASLSDLKIETISTSDVIADVVQSLKYSEEADGVDIRVNIKEGDYRINTCKELLQSILQNLLQNSIKYKNIDKKPYVNITVKSKDKHIHFTVTDNGVGISPKYKEKVFDMFFRANETSHGSGLGLYIVKKSAEKLRGTVKLKDNPGGGTIITVIIPIK